MTHTLAAVFESRADANYARDALVSAGIDGNTIQLNDSASATGAAQQFDATASPAGEGETIVDSIRHFFGRLFGTEDHDQHMYAEAIRRGHVVLTVRATSREQAERAATIVQNFGPLDMGRQQEQEDAGLWSGGEAAPAGAAMRQSGAGSLQGGPAPGSTAPSASGSASGSTSGAASGAASVRAQMGAQAQSGTSAFQQGTPAPGSMQRAQSGTAIPQSSSEPRNADRGAEQGAGTRIYSHPNQGSLNIQRGDSQGISEDTYFRAHWLDTFSYVGGTYQEYDPAYRYGASMANKSNYQGSAWDDVEPVLREEWERKHPESHWDKFKEAVRAGWDRISH
jgi:hypothetical protein